MTVEMTPFDALSLLEGLTAAIFALEDAMKRAEGKKLIQEMYEPKLKDARDNYKEIEAALRKRNDILDGKEVIV